MYLQFSKSYDLKYLKSAAIIIWLFAVKKIVFAMKQKKLKGLTINNEHVYFMQ